MPLRMIKKDRDEKARQQQARQQSGIAQMQETPKPQQMQETPKPRKFGPDSRGLKKAEEPKSPSARRDERKAQQRERRMTLKMNTGGITSYGVSQLGILEALMSGKTKSDIYDTIKEKKEKLFEKGVKPSQIEKMDKLFDKRFDNAMSDFRYKLKNRPGMKEYRKKQRSAPASDTGSEFSKGGLTGGQKKLDKNKNNRIDAEDFKILRGGRAAMKAKKGKLVPLKSDPTKAISSVKPSAGGKGGPPKKTPKEARSAVEDFIKRRKKLMGLKSVIGKGGRIGAAAALLGLAGAGAAKVGQTIGRKIDEAKKKNKKMGGGMMKRPMGYTKGGGADTGTMGEAKSKLATGIDAFKRRLKKEKLQAPKRGPMRPAKAMGGGMMMKPMGYKSGTSVKVKCKLGRNKPTKMY